MWVGNVPSDATMDEANALFSDMRESVVQTSQPSTWPLPILISDGVDETGVISVFLILQSHCAFVNYSSDAHLQRAVAYFHGKPFRTGGLKMVCRPRNKEEEVKSGVGLQRGLGIHRNWVKEHHGDAEFAISHAGSTSPGDSQMRDSSAIPSALESQESASSGTSSTTSSLLQRYFPKRYFVLKAMTKGDLQLSVGLGYWATQSHNESVLNQAYRTSKVVYLIFGANKAGEFHGYAKMDGPVSEVAEGTIAWRPRDSMLSGPQSTVAGLPTAMSPFEQHLRHYETPSTDPQSTAVLGAPSPSYADADGGPPPVAPFAASPTYGGPSLPPPLAAAGPSSWGVPFRVKWIRVKSMPFHQTRAIRNPWNKDREVKVSRDGTELEPTTGQALIDLWEARASPDSTHGEDHIVV